MKDAATPSKQHFSAFSACTSTMAHCRYLQVSFLLSSAENCYKAHFSASGPQFTLNFGQGGSDRKKPTLRQNPQDYCQRPTEAPGSTASSRDATGAALQSTSWRSQPPNRLVIQGYPLVIHWLSASYPGLSHIGLSTGYPLVILGYPLVILGYPPVIHWVIPGYPLGYPGLSTSYPGLPLAIVRLWPVCPL